MKTADFSFDLPPRLIAQFPPEKRGLSRLMTLDRQTKRREHRVTADLPEILSGPELRGAAGQPPLMVFNNSKVRKSRLAGKSLQSDAQVEFLLLEPVTETNAASGGISGGTSGHKKWKTLVQKSGRRKTGSRYAFFDTDNNEIARAEITGEETGFRIVEFDAPIDDNWLDRYGHIPLPPYIKRADTQTDADRYQTVYADVYGSAAAPTAGLHFTDGLLQTLCASGIDCVFVTLHVGMGTFLPVRGENIEDHFMHEEVFSIDETAAAKIENAKNAGRKIIAVGTTSLRTLESAWQKGGGLKRGTGATSIFIYPGFQFQAVDALFTNFHTPQSTLLMLVSAFAESPDAPGSGRKLILDSYAEAIQENYRFFSYGDAMLIT